MDPYYAGWLSILPPVIAIVLALLTKEVISSLLVGILSGTLIYAFGTGAENVLMSTVENTFAIMGKRVDTIKNYGCDGMLCHVNRSCKLMTFHIFVGREIIERDAGVPCANFDGDQSDTRVFNEAQFETRLQGLVEIMKQNKEAQQ